MSDWKPANKEQAEGYEMGKSFVQGFTDRIKELEAENELLKSRNYAMEQSLHAAQDAIRIMQKHVHIGPGIE